MSEGFVPRFIKGVMCTGMGASASISLSFLSVIIAVRTVPKDEFGAYVLFQVMVYFLVMASDLGVNTSVIKFIAGSGAGTGKETADAAAWIKGAMMLSLCVLFLPLAGLLIPVFKSPALAGCAAYAPLLVLLEGTNGFFGAILQGLHLYKKLAAAQALLSAVNFIMLMALVVWLGFGIGGLIAARASALAVSTGAQYAALPFGLRPRLNRPLLKNLFGFGYPLGLNSMLTFVFTKVDTLIIGTLLNPLGVAAYGAATRVPDAFRQMFDSFRSVYFPNMAELLGRNKKEEAVSVLNNSLRAVSFVSCLFALAAALFSGEVVSLLFSARYLDSAPVFAVLMFALAISLAGNVLGTTLVSAGYSKLPFFINLVDAGVNVAANLILVPVYGVMGAAYAALLARAATNPVNLWFLWKKGIRASATEYLKPVAIALACLAGYAMAGNGGIAAKASTLAVFLGLCRAFSVVTQRDAANLARGLKYSMRPAGAATEA